MLQSLCTLPLIWKYIWIFHYAIKYDNIGIIKVKMSHLSKKKYIYYIFTPEQTSSDFFSAHTPQVSTRELFERVSFCFYLLEAASNASEAERFSFIIIFFCRIRMRKFYLRCRIETELGKVFSLISQICNFGETVLWIADIKLYYVRSFVGEIELGAFVTWYHLRESVSCLVFYASWYLISKDDEELNDFWSNFPALFFTVLPSWKHG